MVSVRIVRAIVQAVEQAGIPRQELLRAARFDPGLLEGETGVVGYDVCRLLEAALELTLNPAFGLHWAERQNVLTVGPIAYLAFHAATMRKGFESLARFQGLVYDGQTFQVRESEPEAVFVCTALPGVSTRVQRLAAEVLTLGAYRLVQAYAPRARARVSFEHQAPPYESEYTRVFGEAVQFGQPFTGVAFEREWLDAASPHSDPAVHEALTWVARKRLERGRSKPPCSIRVSEYIVAQGGAPELSMQDVARSLGMSSRSLRRHLAAEGTSFRSVSQRAMVLVAEGYLRDARLSIQETAHRMGFSCQSGFHRAFKRWTGTTPNTFREQEWAAAAQTA